MCWFIDELMGKYWKVTKIILKTNGPLLSFRYDVPGINAMNFMLYNSLGGGGIASLRSDPQVGS